MFCAETKKCSLNQHSQSPVSELMAALLNPTPLQPGAQSYTEVPEDDIPHSQGLAVSFPCSTSTAQAPLGAGAWGRAELSNALAGETGHFMVAPLAASRNLLRSGLLSSTLLFCNRQLQLVEARQTYCKALRRLVPCDAQA